MQIAPSPPKRVLVASLDWGLGHATRCIPIIDGLLALGVEVLIASSGQAFRLLSEAYPQLESWKIPAKPLRYSASKSQVGAMLRQAVRILMNIGAEKRWLATFLQEQQLDAVISDHRLGMHNKRLPCVLMAHQIAIQPPRGLRWLASPLFQAQWRFIKRFDEIWVPDHPGEHELVEDLVPAQVRSLAHVRFIGTISHLTSVQSPPSYPWPERIPLLVILSGLEPQRSLLEEKIRKEVKKYGIETILVQGLSVKTRITQIEHLTLVSYLTAADLSVLIQRAEIILSRSGYSSLMDYASCGKEQIILIPTPGQTEQVYLAHCLEKRKIALCQHQDQLELAAAIEQLPAYHGFYSNETPNDFLFEELDRFVSRITKDNS